MNFTKYRCFFQINLNDVRSDFFLLVLNDIIERDGIINNFNFYNSIFIKNLKENDELNTYLLDIGASDTLIDLTKCSIIDLPSNYIIIIQTFFIVLENDLDITNDNSKWKKTSKLIRKKDKIIKVTKATPVSSYKKSDVTSFTFNKDIINSILKSIISNIPPMKQLDYEIGDIVYKCIKRNKENNYADYLDKCIAGKDIKKCLNFMSNDKFEDNIIQEVKHMDICDAVTILIKFGFTYNTIGNRVVFETILSWEKRIKNKLNVTSINKNLIKYLKLLHQRINPVNELRSKIIQTGLGISSILLNNLKQSSNELTSKYIILESEYNKARYMCNIYNNLMNIFNNKYYKEIFNRDNMYIYLNYYNKIKSEYNIVQSILLNLVENKYSKV